MRLLFQIIPAAVWHCPRRKPSPRCWRLPFTATFQSLTPASKSLETSSNRPLFFPHRYIKKAEIAFQFTCRLRRPFRRRTCCFKPRFRFLIRGSPPDKGGKGEAEEEAAGREKILIERSPPDNEFSPTIQMYLQNA